MSSFFIYKSMRIDNPLDLQSYNNNIDLMLYDKKIVHADNRLNKPWKASIFPSSTNITTNPNNLTYITTVINEDIFKDVNSIHGFNFILLPKLNGNIIINDKRKFIKSIEIGDINDSIKRYVNIDKQVTTETDIKKIDKIHNTNNSEVPNNLAYDNFAHDINYNEFLPESIKNDNIILDKSNYIKNQPYNISNKFNTLNTINKDTLFTNSAYIIEVLKWAKEKGVKYIYCINEYRSNIINTQYVNSYVYYTIMGSY